MVCSSPPAASQVMLSGTGTLLIESVNVPPAAEGQLTNIEKDCGEGKTEPLLEACGLSTKCVPSFIVFGEDARLGTL